MKNFKLDKDADGVLLVTFDMPDRSMNVLNVSSMGEIAELTDMIKSDESIKGAVITSGKKAFCAGADLEVIWRAPKKLSRRAARKPKRRKKPSMRMSIN